MMTVTDSDWRKCIIDPCTPPAKTTYQTHFMKE